MGINSQLLVQIKFSTTEEYRRVPGETQRVIHNISLGRADGTVRAQTVLSLTLPYNTVYAVKYCFLLKY
jgi:hypothetical protein